MVSVRATWIGVTNVDTPVGVRLAHDPNVYDFVTALFIRVKSIRFG